MGVRAATRVVGAAGLAVVLTAGGCSAFGGADDAPPPRPEVIEPGELIYGQRTVLHVGETTVDFAPRTVERIVWTPYGLYVGSIEKGVEYGDTWVFYDGTDLEEVNDIWGEGSVPVSDGRYVAWIDRDGTDQDGEGRVVAVDARTGERIFESRDDMGREPFSDLYSELPPRVLDLVGGDLFWQGVEHHHHTDLATGDTATVRAADLPPVTSPGADGYFDFASPDGRFEVHRRPVSGTTNSFTLRVTPRQPDFAYPVLTPAGWSGPHTLRITGQRLRPRPEVRGTKPGVIASCDLATGRCSRPVRVGGVSGLVFPDYTYPRV